MGKEHSEGLETLKANDSTLMKIMELSVHNAKLQAQTAAVTAALQKAHDDKHLAALQQISKLP